MIVQKILPHDPVQRLQFSEHMLNILPNYIAVIITLDEAHLYKDGHVNKKTTDIGQRKPLDTQKPLHSQKVTVWCSLSTLCWDNLALFLLKMSVDSR